MHEFGGPHSIECLTGRGPQPCPALPPGHTGFGLDGVAMDSRAACVRDPLFLASEVCSKLWKKNLLSKPSEAHREVARAMVDQVNILYVDARGTSKTTLLDEVGGVHQLLCHYNDSLLFLQASMDMAKALVSQVRNQFMYNPVLRLLLPDYAMNQQESGSILSFSVPARQIKQREESVEIATPGSATTGAHYDVIFASDLMGASTTPPPCGRATIEEMKAIIAWYSQVEGLLQGKELNPRAHKRIDSNRWHDADLVGELLRKDTTKTFRRIIRGVKRGPDGKFISTWPEWKTSEMLQDIHDSPAMTPATWAANYCSDPLPEGGMTFKREWIHEFGKGAKCQCGKTHPEPAKIDVAVTVDPAFSDSKTDKQRTDRSAMISSGPSESLALYVDSIRAGRWSPNEFLDNLFAVIDSTSPDWVGIEDTGSSRALIAMFHNEVTRSGRFVNYREIKPGGRSKVSRISTLHQLAQKYGIFVRPGMEDLVEELVRFGVAEHDDLADALAYRAMEMVYGPRIAVAPEKPRLTYVPSEPLGESGDVREEVRRITARKRRIAPKWALRAV